MKTSKILVIFYIVAGIGAMALCGKMIGRISTLAPDRIIYVRAETAKIYSGPSESSVVLLELKRGDKLEYVSTSGESWVLVRNGSFEGYVPYHATNLPEAE